MAKAHSASGRWHFQAAGRGTHYTLARGVLEAVLRQAYRGDWPARLWGALPGRTAVRGVRYSIVSEHPGLTAPLAIAFASDFHIGPTTPAALLTRSFDALAEQHADVVLLGGDFVFLEATINVLARLRSLATRLVKRLGVTPCFAVLGNHDLWSHDHRIEQVLEEAGIAVLHNRCAHIEGAFGVASVCGLDDPWTGMPDGAAAFAEAQGPTIALCHSPDGLPFVAGRGAEVLLSGHTHGGQIALPGGRPIVLPPGPYSKRLSAGHYQVEGVNVVVSRGVGTTELPIRTFAPPEFVTVVLVPRTPLAPTDQLRAPTD